MIWQCPKCSVALEERQGGLACINGHSYDRAKQGYTHLLLANQKNSLDPGDNEVMTESRKRFLRTGYYQPLVSAIAPLVLSQYHNTQCKSGLTILDLGCGEGYYLESLLSLLLAQGVAPKDFHGYGLDVSKSAIKKAAASAKQRMTKNNVTDNARLDFTVASSAHLPIVDHCLDVVLTVFAPITVAEVCRVLKPEGVFIRVVPGPRHLYQLRELIYDTVLLHEPLSVGVGLVLIHQIPLQFKIHLSDSQAIADLLMMTPFNWKGKAEAKQALMESSNIEIEADFLIQVCQLHH